MLPAAGGRLSGHRPTAPVVPCAASTSGRPAAWPRAGGGGRAAPPGRRRRGRAPAPPTAAAASDAGAGAADALAAAPTPFEELCAGQGRKYVIVSGKGGVGKTSLAASLAARFAAAGHTTLVVSTDPAHSLGDSLDQDVSGGAPVLVAGTDLPLWGLEIDPDAEREAFKAYFSSDKGKKDTESVAGGLGMGLGVLQSLADLRLGELLDTPPPGFDEAVAIAKVQQFVAREEYARFTRIVFDTAPTGHTLRLLSVPDFVEASLTKLIALRRKLASASAAVRGLFGARAEGLEDGADRLETLRASIRQVRDLFRDPGATEFVIATIPTVLGVNESARLAHALRAENIPCRRIVVNQIVAPDAGGRYLAAKLRDQQRALAMLAADPGLAPLRVLRAPYLDLEVRGLPALRYFATVAWGGEGGGGSTGGGGGGSGSSSPPAGTSWLAEAVAAPGRRYFMLGGKGGVGKTSCSASLAAALADAGHTTLVVSTDPAHSLSDSLDADVSGGAPVEVPGGDGRLWGLEVDLDAARDELRGLGGGGAGGGSTLESALATVGLGGFASQLADLKLGELLDTPPPGVDEAAAIAKVVQLLRAPEYARFTRVVFDTAPTGHTLRLLALPDFLDTSVGKILALRQKVAALAGAVKGAFGGGAPDGAPEGLDAFRATMAEARALFRDASTTEFVVVTIPTAMAAAESGRLAAALAAEGVPVRTLLVNQVVSGAATDAFLEARRKDQARALERLAHDPELAGLQVIRAPLFDLEVRGVPALTYFGQQVWK